MSYHGDLLHQAGFLARKEPRRPRQASLRRAVSAAYYAVFHLLVHDAIGRLIGGRDRVQLRHCLSRAFHHGDMKKAATGFAGGMVSRKVSPGMNGLPVQLELMRLAETFVDLQQARHEADYDLTRNFTRQEVLDLITVAQDAFADWQVVRQSIQAETFLVALLAQAHMQG